MVEKNLICITFIYLCGEAVWVPQHVWKSEKDLQSSSSTTWVPRAKLRWAGLTEYLYLLSLLGY